MRDSWRRGLHRFCNWVYFDHITVVFPERLPSRGPVLYLALHRNGAVDGFVYNCLLRETTFLISTQLRRNFLARLFFTGIAVTRGKDEGDRSANAGALQECRELLAREGSLCIFPEGTSSLGPRHLPFKSGAIQVILDCLDAGLPIQVIPLGIHYDGPCTFRSGVEVVVGPPISIELPPGLTGLGRLKEMKRRVQGALESVGVNVATAQDQELIEGVASIGAPRSYFKTLKRLENSFPGEIRQAANVLESASANQRLLRRQNVPLFSTSPILETALLLLLSPIVLAAIILNLPPFVAAAWAGRKFPDDRNVISLWRILVGVPLLILWIVLIAILSVLFAVPFGLASYVVLTFLGLKLYSRVRMLAVATFNTLRCPAVRAPFLDFQKMVAAHFSDETV